MWQFSGDRQLIWGDRTYLMGVLNVTPDSFSDGGQFDQLGSALQQAHRLVKDGADVLDIGGESTRPQAEAVALAEELRRVVPVIQAIRQGAADFAPLNTLISVDTTKAAVARAAIAAGADLVNDISGATFDEAMLPTVAELGVPIVLMHIRGTPKTMQQLTDYSDLVGEVYDFFARRIEAAIAHGIPHHHIALDPGIGFAKTAAQSLELLRRIEDFKPLGCPILIGPSRKSFIGHILNQPDPQQRIWGTAAACAMAIAHGADILRVHDVAEMRDVCRVADAIERQG
ncbi:MAG: dihydropteroate synthase [Cyanobacteriota bacterium]